MGLSNAIVRGEGRMSKGVMFFTLLRGLALKPNWLPTFPNISNGNVNFGMAMTRMGPASGGKLLGCDARVEGGGGGAHSAPDYSHSGVVFRIATRGNGNFENP